MKKGYIIAIYVILCTCLVFFVIQLPYKKHYNNGNKEYQKGNYISAIKEYDKALNLFPTKYNECSIRINKALSMIKKIKKNDENSFKIMSLLSAREVLCEKGCANENDNNGHSEEAEKLKKEIDEEIEKLKQQEENRNNKEDKNDDDEKNEDKKDETEKKLEMLQEMQEQGLESRQLDLEQANEISNYSYDYYDGKNW